MGQSGECLALSFLFVCVGQIGLTGFLRGFSSCEQSGRILSPTLQGISKYNHPLKLGDLYPQISLPCCGLGQGREGMAEQFLWQDLDAYYTAG